MQMINCESRVILISGGYDDSVGCTRAITIHALRREMI